MNTHMNTEKNTTAESSKAQPRSQQLRVESENTQKQKISHESEEMAAIKPQATDKTTMEPAVLETEMASLDIASEEDAHPGPSERGGARPKVRKAWKQVPWADNPAFLGPPGVDMAGHPKPQMHRKRMMALKKLLAAEGGQQRGPCRGQWRRMMMGAGPGHRVNQAGGPPHKQWRAMMRMAAMGPGHHYGPHHGHHHGHHGLQHGAHHEHRGPHHGPHYGPCHAPHHGPPKHMMKMMRMMMMMCPDMQQARQNQRCCGGKLPMGPEDLMGPMGPRATFQHGEGSKGKREDVQHGPLGPHMGKFWRKMAKKVTENEKDQEDSLGVGKWRHAQWKKIVKAMKEGQEIPFHAPPRWFGPMHQGGLDGERRGPGGPFGPVGMPPHVMRKMVRHWLRKEGDKKARTESKPEEQPKEDLAAEAQPNQGAGKAPEVEEPPLSDEACMESAHTEDNENSDEEESPESDDKEDQDTSDHAAHPAGPMPPFGLPPWVMMRMMRRAHKGGKNKPWKQWLKQKTGPTSSDSEGDAAAEGNGNNEQQVPLPPWAWSHGLHPVGPMAGHPRHHGRFAAERKQFRQHMRRMMADGQLTPERIAQFYMAMMGHRHYTTAH